jgi:Flp pilus assembly protein TadD
LGLLAYSHGDYPRSMSSLRQYAEKSTNDAEVFFDLGMDYYKLKRPKDSKQALEHALDLGVADNMAVQGRTVLKELK